MNKLKILIIGSGGREHAIAWKLAQSSLVENVFVAPGNGGTAIEGKVENVVFDNPTTMIKFIRKFNISFTLIGPEQPLADGLSDLLLSENLAVIAPRQLSAQLESSKVFSKKMMEKAKIPTASYQIFNNANLAYQYVKNQKLPIVIKADGLAAGKGVVVAETYAQANEAIENIMVRKIFGSAGNTVVIEECVQGEESSFIVLTDGKNIAPLSSAQDHKRLLDNDLGPNTGGMGVVTPAKIITPSMREKILQTVITPIINVLNQEMPFRPAYQGFLYAGLMIDKSGNINVLEFNCRLGDPETQPLLYALENCDLAEIFLQTLVGELPENAFSKNKNKASVGVVIASGGYPLTVQKNEIINGLSDVTKIPDVKVFHAGTSAEKNNILVSGGRVLCVTAKDNTLEQAREKAYKAISKISFNGMQYRKDIGAKII